jgi:hypothetical protein
MHPILERQILQKKTSLSVIHIFCLIETKNKFFNLGLTHREFISKDGKNMVLHSKPVGFLF